MPLHAIQHLSPTAVLGLWHLTETPAELWAGLPNAAAYQALLPAAAATRQAQWLAGRRLIHRLFEETMAPPPAYALVRNDATGRPWLTGAAPGAVVSLSHSGAWVAAVLAQGGRAGVIQNKKLCYQKHNSNPKLLLSKIKLQGNPIGYYLSLL